MSNTSDQVEGVVLELESLGLVQAATMMRDLFIRVETAEAALKKAGPKSLEEASAEADRIASEWRAKAESTHSSQQTDALRTWVIAAQSVSMALADLVRQSEAEASAIPETGKPLADPDDTAADGARLPR